MNSNLFLGEHCVSQGCINLPQAINLWWALNHVLWANVPGDIIEVGCLSGRTAAMLKKTILEFTALTDRQLFLYDSFEGLSDPTVEDGQIPFDPKAFKTTHDEVRRRFDEFGLPHPFIVAGWVHDTLPYTLPDCIAFAHIDLDLYAPTKHALECVYPRLSPGAIVVVDDYCDPALVPQIEQVYNENPYSRSPYAGDGVTTPVPPRQYHIGNWVPAVKRACDEFLADKDEEWTVMLAAEEKHAFFRKIL